MREQFVYAALVLVICGAIYLVTQGMNLMNQPSDLKVAGGAALIVSVFVLFPTALKWIWHHKTTPHDPSKR
jgi:flagellar biosynthesis protein FliP